MEKSRKKRLKPYTVSGEANFTVEEAFTGYQPMYTDNITLLIHSKKGLKAKAAFDFIHISGFSYQEFQETFNTTVKTIQNYDQQGNTLDATLSEKLLKCFALYAKGAEVFGSVDAFTEWLNTSAYGLGNQIPYELMDTITGIDLIEEELVRIEYGDLA